MGLWLRSLPGPSPAISLAAGPKSLCVLAPPGPRLYAWEKRPQVWDLLAPMLAAGTKSPRLLGLAVPLLGAGAKIPGAVAPPEAWLGGRE